MRSPARTLTAVLAAVTGVVGGLVATPTPAVAAETYARPAGDVFEVQGHGWGHGRGMSQWGAQGAASKGLTADQITGFYYPGTAKTVLADAAIRVLLQADEGVDTQVVPSDGLEATDVATGASLALSTTPKRWRALATSAGLALQSWDGSTWTGVPLDGKAAVAGPLRFSGTTFVRVVFPGGTSRDYRGHVQAVKTGTTSLQTIDTLGLEDYLLGVVPRESSASWAAAALQSQAIAARSYSANKRSRVPSSARYDICDTTQCQVFGGSASYTASGTRTSLEPASTTEAVRATKGVVRTYDGTPIFSEYSSSNGGWSTTGGQPYLVAQRDDYDGLVANSVHEWKAQLRVSDVERRYPALGSLVSMEVTERDGNGEWGGRVKQVVLRGTKDGAATTVKTTGAGIYNARSWPANGDGLRSSWWRFVPASGSKVVSQSAAPRLVKAPGPSTGAVTAVIENTGTTSWSTDGLHLAVASPPGEADPLAGGSTTPGAYTGSATSIAPGERAEFRVALDAAGVAPGTHGRAYRLRIGTGPLFGATVSWRIPVDAALWAGTPAAAPAAAPGSTATSTAPDAPSPVFADGRTVVVPRTGDTTVRLAVRNTGNLTWPAGPTTPLLLGTSAARDRASASAGPTWLSPKRAARMAGTADVAPDATASFDLPLVGNGLAAGVTSESFEPLWEGKHWVDGAPTTLTVVRTDPTVSRLASADTLPPASFTVPAAPNGTATLTIRLRNLGSSPWQVGSESLGTASDKAYPLATAAWPSPSRPPALARNVTRPGVTTVHPGEVGEWKVPLSAYKKPVGDHVLRLQAVGATARYGPVVTATAKVVKAVVSGSLVAVRSGVTVPRTGTATVWFDVKNTGNTAWPVKGVVRSTALTSGSPSRHSSWLTATRPSPVTANLSRPGGTYVSPGQVARFSFVLAGNGRSAGSRTEQFGVLWEGFAGTALKVSLPYRVG
ncbi:MAG: SpoIID/LytB domain-containing protein [Mycobacteriales bacterium]|nr:SpoIID/LytB domain-containing protein [Mycobacteriales bacterium]